MSKQRRGSLSFRADRRDFFRTGLRAAGALAALPAASLLLAGCGSGEEPAKPTLPAPSEPPAPPSKPPAPPAPPPQAQAPPAPAPTPAPAGDGAGQLVTETASVASLVAALQYVNESAKPDQKCSGCQLYTAGADGRGKCQLFPQGLVTEAGWCASWVAKIPVPS